MPRRSLTLRAAAVLTAAVLGASLAACSDTTRIPPAPAGTDTAEPLFASDEEALAAAVEAYEEFADLVDQFLMGNEPSRQLSEVASSPVVEQALQDIEEFSALGWTITDGRRTLNPTLQSRIAEDDESETVLFYLCEDVSRVDVLDSSGESVLDEDRNAYTPLEVAVRLWADQSSSVLDRRVWDGAGVCT